MTTYDVANALADLPIDSPGHSHALNLLLLALAKVNPAAGALLDEFTSMHAEYLLELQALAPDSADRAKILEDFASSAKAIYKRLSSIEAKRSDELRAGREDSAAFARFH
jgi:hypothetical protein